jgi:hypothetical protein
VQEPVEDGGGQDVVAQDIFPQDSAPFGEVLVAGQDDRAAL